MASEDSEHQVVLFLSTGRCGTQFLADRLSAVYSDLARVEHEPHSQEYAPPHFFSTYHGGDSIVLRPAIQKHLADIRRTLSSRHYVEVGWPIYGVLPRLLLELEGRVRVVHLYRHPVRVAASLTTHSVYGRGEWTDEMSISPGNVGVVQGYLAGSAWETMSEFEKCLFWWTEINQYAIDLQNQFPQIPWLSMSFEDMLLSGRPDSMKRLLKFMSLPERGELFDSLTDRTDKYSRTTQESLEIDSLLKYPKAIEVMEQLGYSYDPAMLREVKERYKSNLRSRMRRRLKGAWSRVMGRSAADR